MPQLHLSRIFFDVTLSSVIILSIMLFSIITFTVIRRLMNNRTDLNMRNLVPLFKELARKARGHQIPEAEIKQAIEPGQFKYFEMFLRNTLSDADARDYPAYRHISNVSGFHDFIRAQARNKKRWRQALAVRTLTYLRDPGDIPLFRDVFNNSGFFHSVYAAALGICLCKDASFLEQIIYKIFNRKVSNLDMLMTLIYPLGMEAMPVLLALLQKGSLPPPTLAVLVDFLGLYRYQAAGPVLNDLLRKTGDLELKLHIMDAMGSMGTREFVPVLQQYLQDGDFRVRLKTANVLSKLSATESIPALEKLLEDQNWWVRRNAAEALLKLGEKGIQALQKVKESRAGAAGPTANMILVEERFHRHRARTGKA